jgi:uncharacterized protein YnzC (UPF0291/DUF896 family)
MKGKKTGGRKPGTRNKSKAELFDEFNIVHGSFNPLVSLINLANRTDNDSLKYNCYKEVAKYILPQLKSIQVIDEKDNDITIRVVRTAINSNDESKKKDGQTNIA